MATDTNDAQVLFEALTAAADENGRTRAGYEEALRAAGSADSFSTDGELDEARVNAAAAALVEQGLLATRGPGYKYVGAAAAAPASSRGRSSSGRGRGRGRKAAASRRGARKTTARKSTARTTTAARSASSSRGTSRSTASRAQAAAAAAAGGSPYLAQSLTDLLTQMSSEVDTVSALAARIDDAARGLQQMLSEYCDRIATLAQLRSTVSGGPLAQFLEQELRPEIPAELENLDGASNAAQSAHV